MVKSLQIRTPITIGGAMPHDGMMPLRSHKDPHISEFARMDRNQINQGLRAELNRQEEINRLLPVGTRVRWATKEDGLNPSEVDQVQRFVQRYGSEHLTIAAVVPCEGWQSSGRNIRELYVVSLKQGKIPLRENHANQPLMLSAFWIIPTR